MAKLKLLAVGASRLLGSRLLECLRNSPDFEFHPVSRSVPSQTFYRPWYTADVADYNALANLFEKIEPDCVVNLVNLPVAECERDSDRARRELVMGSENLGRLCGKTIRLIHFSTDMVYSGKKGAPYDLSDEPSPVSVYGKYKLAGEEAVLRTSDYCAIVRSALIFGRPLIKPTGFIHWMAENVKAKRPFNLFTDQWRTPIDADDLVRLVKVLARDRVARRLLAGGDRRVNRVEIGQWMLAGMGVGYDLIRPSTMEEAKLDVPLQQDLALSNDSLKTLIDFKLTDIETTVRSAGKEYASI